MVKRVRSPAILENIAGDTQGIAGDTGRYRRRYAHFSSYRIGYDTREAGSPAIQYRRRYGKKGQYRIGYDFVSFFATLFATIGVCSIAPEREKRAQAEVKTAEGRVRMK